MARIAPLAASRLHATFDPERIPWKDSSKVPVGRIGSGRADSFQPRAMQALDLALKIRATGYNVYLSGEADLGRSYMLLNYLRPRARHGQTPPDLVYVQNFADPDRPLLLSLPAGLGKKFKKCMNNIITAIGRELARRFETQAYDRKRARLIERFQKVRMGLISKMSAMATHRGFTLEVDENGGLSFLPLVKGKRLSEEEFGRLDNDLRLDIRRRGDSLTGKMAVFLRQMNKAEESLRKDEHELELQAMQHVLDAQLAPLRERMLKLCPTPAMQDYFSALREDILQNTNAFLPHDSCVSQGDALALPSNENGFYRYQVNLFVDNSELSGAPIVVEDNPTVANLLGCIERESEMGALVTDFTLIRAGSLHKANGGFLVLHMEDILQHPAAWEGLLRSLRTNQARIEDGGEASDSTMRTKGILPEQLTLGLKVVLIGDEDLYENLLVADERFAKLFRIKAHMTDVADRKALNIKTYIGHIARIACEAKLQPFERDALAWLVDLGSHLCEDQRRLSLRFPLLRELMIEASALAELRGIPRVNAAILEDAYAARTYRANLDEEAFMEEYDREIIKVQTSGTAVGQVNGLSVTWRGNYEFGLPHRISCTVGVGQDGIIDLEREADLGGPIHTKAMMILKSYLTALFASTKPLMLSASLYFEQSYAGIEGDSASGAELAALLSAIAETPMRLDLAFTGAVSHSGQILAVGGVTRKVEGFFKVCKRHGLTGSQGVIIPHDNVDHLMLSPDVLSAVESGFFAIYPVRRIEEALMLLSGLPAGKRRANGRFTPGSLYALVDQRLERLGCYGQTAFKRTRSN